MTVLPEPTYTPIELVDSLNATECMCNNSTTNILPFVNLGFNLFYMIILFLFVVIPLTNLKRKVEFLWMRDKQEYQII